MLLKMKKMRGERMDSERRSSGSIGGKMDEMAVKPTALMMEL